MTRRLLLIRHAEAGMTPHGGGDHDRTLSPHGVAQAEAIGALIADGVLPRPDLVFTSSAVRARQTWEAAASRASLAAPTVADRALYGARHTELVDVLREVPDAVGAVALVGHAPEIPALAFSVPDARAIGLGTRGWPAACVGVVEVTGTWSEFPDAGARLVLALAVEPE